MKARLIVFIAAACISVGPLYHLITAGTVALQPAAAASIDQPNGKKEGALAAFANLPLGFEANRGQTNPRVKFLARGRGYTLFLTPTEAVLVSTNPTTMAEGSEKTGETILRMEIVGANPDAAIVGLEERSGKSHYFLGRDPRKWQTNLPTYGKVHYQAIYSGIDLVFYGNGRQLEYDFVVAPGADPQKISLSFQGAQRLEVDERGDLVLHAADGSFRLLRPVVYQEVKGVRKEIPGEFELQGESQVGFLLADYDASSPLIIDPKLEFSTYLGGSGNDNINWGIAVDGCGNIYVAGTTTSTDFPKEGALQENFGGGLRDAFVAKLNPDGLVYSTYLGGSANDNGNNIAVDARGRAYVTGSTGSSNFPTTPGAFQETIGTGVPDAFVTKLNRNGSGLVFSTYLGGPGFDTGTSIALDHSGEVYVAGVTGDGFPTTRGAFQTKFGGAPDDVYVAKLKADGSALVYSTFLGGSGSDIPRGLAVDGRGNAYVSGQTGSFDSPDVPDDVAFPTTPGAFQTAFGSAADPDPETRLDGFVAKVNASGSALVYSTYLGGSGEEQGLGIALDADDNAYVAGRTRSDDFPTTKKAFQASLRGEADAFVAKLNWKGSRLVYSTYLGGSGYDDNFGGIAVDGRGNVFLTGETRSDDFPTRQAFQDTYGGGTANGDAYVAKLNAEGKLVFSSYLGGGGGEFANALALDPFGGVNVAGRTNSADWLDNSFQAYGGGTFDAFVAQVTGLDLDHDYDHDHDNDYGHDHGDNYGNDDYYHDHYDDNDGKW